LRIADICPGIRIFDPAKCAAGHIMQLLQPISPGIVSNGLNLRISGLMESFGCLASRRAPSAVSSVATSLFGQEKYFHWFLQDALAGIPQIDGQEHLVVVTT
jgi:hypothetical protein